MVHICIWANRLSRLCRNFKLRIHQSSAASRRLFNLRVELIHDLVARANIINVVPILDGQVSKTSDPSWSKPLDHILGDFQIAQKRWRTSSDLRPDMVWRAVQQLWLVAQPVDSWFSIRTIFSHDHSGRPLTSIGSWWGPGLEHLSKRNWLPWMKNGVGARVLSEQGTT